MRIQTIADFLEVIQDLQAQHLQEILYFRGESRDNWELSSSVRRSGLILYESEMLTELIARRPEEFRDRATAISQFVLAQHHGLKTRFLDVTKNPLVALFHACEVGFGRDCKIHIFAAPRNIVKTFESDTVSIIANFAKLPPSQQNALLTSKAGRNGADYGDAIRHLYQLIRGEKPYFEERIAIEDLFRVFVIEPQQSSERIRAQSGAFLASAFHPRFEREEVLNSNPRVPIYAHYTPTVPSASKENILRQLSLLNITRETLFPGLDESARAITESYRQRLQDTDTTATEP